MCVLIFGDGGWVQTSTELLAETAGHESEVQAGLTREGWHIHAIQAPAEKQQKNMMACLAAAYITPCASARPGQHSHSTSLPMHHPGPYRPTHPCASPRPTQLAALLNAAHLVCCQQAAARLSAGCGQQGGGRRSGAALGAGPDVGRSSWNGCLEACRNLPLQPSCQCCSNCRQPAMGRFSILVFGLLGRAIQLPTITDRCAVLLGDHVQCMVQHCGWGEHTRCLVATPCTIN